VSYTTDNDEVNDDTPPPVGGGGLKLGRRSLDVMMFYYKAEIYSLGKLDEMK
jgi:hypothetical protein